MVRNLKSTLLSGLFMLLGGSTLLCGEYNLDEFRSVIGAGGMVAQTSSGNTYVMSGVLGQMAIGDRSDSKYSMKQGFWILDDETVSVEDGQISLDSRLNNYPNPFNSSTKINYELPDAAYVTVRVYDLVGNLVKTIFDGYQDGGVKDLVWDGTDNGNNSLSSGSYVCEMSVRPAQLSAGETFSAFVSRNVMVIVR